MGGVWERHMNRTWGAGIRRRWVRATGAVAITALAMAGAVPAVADDIANRLDSSVDAAAETMPLNVGGANGTTQLYVVTQKDDGKNGCNLTGGSTLTLSVASSNTSVATVSPSSVTFNSCGAQPALTVTPVAQGSATISVSETSNTTAGSFNLSPATFTVNVTAPAPANTAPSIAVAGVSGGASYDKGSAPTATCQVTDAEDGNRSFPATLSAISGPYASDGIGSQTASCSYTDRGGLIASASETYSIVDRSAPTIGYTLNPATPDGANGWYTGNVSLAWQVADAQSPNSLQKSDCVDKSVTADQPATQYSCSATSAGGSAGPVSVSVKRDGTAPQVSAGAVTGTLGNNGWYRSDVTVAFTATDALSGPASQSESARSTGEGAEVVVSSPAFSDLAGNTRAAGAASQTVKIDKSAPNPPRITLDPNPNDAGWNDGPVIVTFNAAGDNGPSDNVTCTEAETIEAETTGTTVSGTCTDEAGNESSATEVTVKLDSKEPVVTVKDVRGISGQAGWYVSPVEVDFEASDTNGSGIVGDAVRTVTSQTEGAGVDILSPAFSDVAGNTAAAATAKATVNIDSRKPNAPAVSLSAPANGSGWHNAAVTVRFASNGDNGASGVASCTADVAVEAETAASGQVVTGTCTDAAGNESDATSVTIKLDMTAPVVTNVAPTSAPDGSNGWYRTAVTHEFRATDGLSGFATQPDPYTFTVGSGSAEGSSVTVSSGTVTDRAGNEATAIRSPGYSVDLSDPRNVAFEGGPGSGSSYYFGAVPAKPTCTAADDVSGFAACDVTGYSTAVGTHTMTATATDNAGRTATATRSYTVLPWTAKGYYAPVDMGSVFNTVKGGSTVPLKFEGFAGSTELTDVSSISAFKQQKISCSSSAAEDAIEEIASTGGTSLRYDSTGGQFIQNWKTPTGANTCYAATVTFLDGSSISAKFKLK